MKKSLKLLLVVLLCGVMLLALTGCGNKIKATKETDEGKETIEYEDKEEAQAAWALMRAFSELDEEEDYKVKLSGKKVTLTMKGEYVEDLYEDMTKEEIIEVLEDDDYDVK